MPLADPDCFAYRARSVDAYIDGSTPKWKTEFASVDLILVVFFLLWLLFFNYGSPTSYCLNKLNNLIFFRLCYDFLPLKVNVSRRKSK